MSSTCETFSSKPMSSGLFLCFSLDHAHDSIYPGRDHQGRSRLASGALQTGNVSEARLWKPQEGPSCQGETIPAQDEEARPCLPRQGVPSEIIFGCNGRVWIGDANQGDEVEQELSIGTREVICRLANAVRAMNAAGVLIWFERVVEAFDKSLSSATTIREMLDSRFEHQVSQSSWNKSKRSSGRSSLYHTFLDGS
ncbi:uncharacterized protein LOC112343199 isoform X3 [Selaginella moellendorffii]|uniref:uncharacterized protein LOC112343199 isoform X3 n=1 Tax=Selaginella moellendorffii TaxID=88036 RepID=UPI000D1C52DD|nr:uncharacterized protein LOC112343199 isoform X3 [Selaginella moellendorffii]|eukprot:XP_024522067.1 uncharacterized protein LOC112343199 isoform X3 [Selaginella moellendorffii]